MSDHESQRRTINVAYECVQQRFFRFLPAPSTQATIFCGTLVRRRESKHVYDMALPQPRARHPLSSFIVPGTHNGTRSSCNTRSFCDTSSSCDIVVSTAVTFPPTRLNGAHHFKDVKRSDHESQRRTFKRRLECVRPRLSSPATCPVARLASLFTSDMPPSHD